MWVIRNVSAEPKTLIDRFGTEHEVAPDGTVEVHPRDGKLALRDPAWERVRSVPEED